MADEALKFGLDSGLADEIVAPAGQFVLFGCSGDLARRKIAPALYNLHVEGRLPETFVVVGVGRRAWDDALFREEMRQAIETHSRRDLDEATWREFASRWFYQQTILDEPASFQALAARLARLDEAFGTGGSRAFYLAMAPAYFGPIADALAACGLHRPAQESGFSRLIVEKPFGRDLASAQKLNRSLWANFDEEQIFRIDHYLGKETVQNLLVFRFANSLFEPHFSAEWVDNVQITAAEPFGMEGRRGAYYEQAGALRDMVQNHMLQLLALIAMERPDCLRCDAVRAAKAKVLRAISPMTPALVSQRTVRGQYREGSDREASPAYRQEWGVGLDSTIETYAACQLFIDNPRWQGVPFYLRTGKRLPTKTTQIQITFKREASSLFHAAGCDMRGENRLILQISPKEDISLRFDVKIPGAAMMLRPVRMDFNYATAFASGSPEGYEHLLLDAMRGDSTLFIHADELEAAWSIVDSIQLGWQQADETSLGFYGPGEWGPADADRIFGDPYKHWNPV